MTTNQTPPRRAPGRPGAPWLFVWTADDHNVARVKAGPRGEPQLHRILVDLCEVAGTVPPQRTPVGGWIVSLPIVDDLRAYARVHGQWLKVIPWKST